jgi:tetratricopeptide (TPR) repeat protein
MNALGKTAILAAVIIIVTLAVPAVGQPERGIQVGQRIEPRQLRTIDREKIMLPAEEGLTVVLFWSTWSPRSKPALELWKKYGDLYKEHNFSVLTVNAENQHMEADDIQKVGDYMALNDVTLPVIVDSGLELFNEIGIIVLPTVLFFEPDGSLEYKYAGLPTSAELDLKGDLEAKLGIARKPSAEEEVTRGKLDYQPKNNALLFYNMGKRIHEKGFPEKAKEKYIEALQKDPEYTDPLRSLEGLFFDKGRTPEARERLESLLTASGLEEIIGNISMEDDIQAGEEQAAGQISAPEDTPQAAQVPAPATTPEAKELTPMERMKLLMEKNKK